MKIFCFSITIRPISLFVIFFIFCSCQSVSHQQQKQEAEQVNADDQTNDESAEKNIPAFLWSPGQRRSTAGFYYLTAEYLALTGGLEKAKVLFEQAYNLDPNPFLGGKYIAVQAQTGQMEKVLPEAKKLVLLYPKSPELHFLYGQLLGQSSFYELAVEALEKSIDLDPTTEDVYLYLMELHWQNKNNLKALVITKELVKRLPHSTRGWVALAKLHLTLSQKKEALRPARIAYEMQSSNPETILVYALTLELNGEPKKAIALYEQLHSFNPANEELMSRMIDLYRQIGDLKDALNMLTELSKLPGGNRPAVQMQRAIILWELNRAEEAAAIFADLVEKYPDSDRILYLNGLAQEKINKPDKAIKNYLAVPSSSSFFLQAQLRSALLYKEQKQFEPALKIIEELLQNEQIAWDVYALGASIYSDANRDKAAIDLLELGYKRHPDKHRLLFLKGVYQEKNGGYQDCIATMRQVIKVDPENNAAYNYLGYLFAEHNENLAEAEQLIKKALELKPNDGYYLDSLGWVYFQQKKYPQALEVLLKSLAIVPNEGVVLEHISDVYNAMGDLDNAKAFIDKAVKARVDDRDKKRIEEKHKLLNPHS